MNEMIFGVADGINALCGLLPAFSKDLATRNYLLEVAYKLSNGELTASVFLMNIKDKKPSVIVIADSKEEQVKLLETLASEVLKASPEPSSTPISAQVIMFPIQKREV